MRRAPIPLALTLACLLVSGCAQVAPAEFKAGQLSTPDSMQLDSERRMTEGWNSVPVMTEGRSSLVLVTPFTIPDEVANRKLSLELEPGSTINDIVAILGRTGVPVIISDADAGNRSFFLPKYTGRLGPLLSAITRATDVWFTWHEGTVVVSEKARVSVTIPQEKTLAAQMEKGIKDLQISDAAVAWHAGMLSASVKPSEFEHLHVFLDRLTKNAAVVTLQVAVVNVALNHDVKQGVDWEALQASVVTGGDVAQYRRWQDAFYRTETAAGQGLQAANTALGQTGTATGTTPTTAQGTDEKLSPSQAMAALEKLGAVSLSSGGIQGSLFTKLFSFTGLFRYLETFGDTETRQNLLLTTVGGEKTEFKSVMSIPYVSEIGVTTTGSSTSGASALGSTKTEKAQDGITLEMTPLYDAAANTVTVDMKLSLEAVIAFNELSAGNQLGKLTQPTTAERSFTDTLRLRPGQTVVVGGINYDNVSNNRGAPPFLTGTKLSSQTLKVTRQAMYIVVRPSVRRLGQVVVADEAELKLLQRAQGERAQGERESVGPKSTKVRETREALSARPESEGGAK